MTKQRSKTDRYYPAGVTLSMFAVNSPRHAVLLPYPVTFPEAQSLLKRVTTQSLFICRQDHRTFIYMRSGRINLCQLDSLSSF